MYFYEQVIPMKKTALTLLKLSSLYFDFGDQIGYKKLKINFAPIWSHPKTALVTFIWIF